MEYLAVGEGTSPELWALWRVKDSRLLAAARRRAGPSVRALLAVGSQTLPKDLTPKACFRGVQRRVS